MALAERQGALGRGSWLQDICPDWANTPFLDAEEMVGAWFRQMKQAVKWQKEMKRQSRSEGEPWYKVEDRSQ